MLEPTNYSLAALHVRYVLKSSIFATKKSEYLAFGGRGTVKMFRLGSNSGMGSDNTLSSPQRTTVRQGQLDIIAPIGHI